MTPSPDAPVPVPVSDPVGAAGPRRDAPLRLSARTPADLVAAAVVSLGFEPEESVVMLTFGPHRAFHARLDLPAPGAEQRDLEAMVAALVRPAVRHRVARVALLHFSERGRPEARFPRLLEDAMLDAGIDVVVQGWVGRGRLRPLLGHAGPDLPRGGVRVDPLSHPFVAESVLAGHPLRRSRDDLARLVAPGSVEAREAVRIALHDLVDPVTDQVGPLPAGTALVELVQAQAQVVAGGGAPDDATVALLLAAVAGFDARMTAWCPASRFEASTHADLWAEVLRRAPERFGAGAASLLALAAAYAGNGALAWCAIDRGLADDEDDELLAAIAWSVGAAAPPESYGPAAMLERARSA